MTTPVKTARDVFLANCKPSSIRPLGAHEQSKVARWQREQFGDQPLVNQVLGVCEEAGELCHSVLKSQQKIRGMADQEAFLEAAGDAVADCTIFLMQVATKLQLDFATLVCQTVAEVVKRDWKAKTTSDTNDGAHPYDLGVHDC